MLTLNLPMYEIDYKTHHILSAEKCILPENNETEILEACPSGIYFI